MGQNEHAILLAVHQYEGTNRKLHLKSTHDEEVKAAMEQAISKGLETWMVEMTFEQDRGEFDFMQE